MGVLSKSGMFGRLADLFESACILIVGGDLNPRLRIYPQEWPDVFQSTKCESTSHFGTYTITIKSKAEREDSEASPFCAIEPRAV